jgi:diguanylate cyclase (GGDEF)-like protein
MHPTTLPRLHVVVAQRRDQIMNAVANSSALSINAQQPNAMSINAAATLITRELTLQRNRNRILAASHQDLLNEIARLRQENADLEKIACIDSLTGIFNRHMLLQEIGRSIKSFQRHNTPAVMLLIDLNHFKHINDEFGHAVGDKALCAAARHLASSVRATDCVGRLGGDEFVVILNNTVTADALHIADKLHHAAPTVNCTIECANNTSADSRIALRYSIGHATLTSDTLNNDTCNADAWLHAADLSMYRSKFFERNKR